jgi:hypothetical protein
MELLSACKPEAESTCRRTSIEGRKEVNVHGGDPVFYEEANHGHVTSSRSL